VRGVLYDPRGNRELDFIGISVSPLITRPKPMQYIKGYNWQSRDKFPI
jgi:hypothetical protein